MFLLAALSIIPERHCLELESVLNQLIQVTQLRGAAANTTLTSNR